MNVKILFNVLATLPHFLRHEALKSVAILVISIKDRAALIMINTKDVAAWLDPADFKEQLVALIDICR